jgi:hypothetical protein
MFIKELLTKQFLDGFAEKLMHSFMHSINFDDFFLLKIKRRTLSRMLKSIRTLMNYK